jgi:hypothetical protein
MQSSTVPLLWCIKQGGVGSSPKIVSESSQPDVIPKNMTPVGGSGFVVVTSMSIYLLGAEKNYYLHRVNFLW